MRGQDPDGHVQGPVEEEERQTGASGVALGCSVWSTLPVEGTGQGEEEGEGPITCLPPKPLAGEGGPVIL